MPSKKAKPRKKPGASQNKMGRPTPYNPAYVEQVEKLCKLGAIDQELADFFNVHRDTIFEWKKKHPAFAAAMQRGKMLADAEVADKLFRRATGYQHPDVDIKVIEGNIVKTDLIKHYPPDTVAAIFWLKNRAKKQWKDKHEIDLDLSGDVEVVIE